MTNGFLLQSRIVDTGRAGVTCGAGRDVVHPQRRVLMQIVDPAAVQCLPSIVRQEPIGVMATPSFRFSCIGIGIESHGKTKRDVLEIISSTE